MIKELIKIFGRDLNKLREEISLYGDESNLWIVKGDISNSAGNLCLHLVGNLNHFIGATLGKTGYVRTRDAEFSTKNVPRKQLIELVEKTILTVEKSLIGLTEEELQKDFPLEKHGEVVRTDFMLLHLLTHLNYHIGQINYHRRLIEAV
jgi:hypothetical protein